MNDNVVSRILLSLIVIWYLIMPFSKQMSLGQGGAVDLNLSRILGVLIVVLCTFGLFFNSFKRIPYSITIPTIFFLIILLISCFWSNQIHESLIIYFRIYGGFVLMLYFLSCPSQILVTKIHSAVVAVSLLCAVYTIVQYIVYQVDINVAFAVFGQDSYWISYPTVRPRGIVGSVGGSSSVMSLGIVSLFLRFMKYTASKKEIIFIIILAVGILLNFTRTFIILLLIFIFLGLIYQKQWKKIVLFVVFVNIMLISMVLWLGPERFIDRLSDIPGISSRKVTSDQMLMGRGLLWKIGLDEFQDYTIAEKITGKGLNWANHIVSAYFSNRDGSEGSVHNDFIWLLCNVGIVGFFSYFLFIILLCFAYRGNNFKLFFSFVFIFFIMSGFGGDTIAVTGHRYMQILVLVNFFNNDRLSLKHD